MIRAVVNIFVFTALVFWHTSSTFAVEVELRLVPFDHPETTVDKLDKSRPLTNPVSTPKGMVIERVGVETVTWARNVLLDGKSIFERYHDGKYIDRLPVARAELQPGDHTIWPGGQAFTVAADGALTSKSAELTVDAKVVKIRCYPVTVRAFRANPDEGDLPMSMRIAALPPLTIRDSGEAPKDAAKDGKPVELLPIFDKFSPLTLWLPANTAGKGYQIHPLGLTFHLGPDGVKPAAGGGQSIDDLRVTKNLIDIPLYTYHVLGTLGQQNKVIVAGVEQLTWGPYNAEQTTSWSPRATPYVLQTADVGPTISIDGDLRKLPLKGMTLDSSDRLVDAHRLVVVESESRHLTPGKSLHARIRATDTRPASAAEHLRKAADNDLTKASTQLAAATTKKGAAEGSLKGATMEVAAKTEAINKPDADEATKKSLQAEITALNAKIAEYNATISAASTEAQALQAKVEQLKPIVADLKAKLDAVAETNPAADAQAFAQIRSYDGGEWKDLDVKPQGGPREFDLAIPDVPAGVYRLRVGVKGIDKTQRPSAVESWVTIAGEKPYSVGLFTNRNRDSYYQGEGFWFAIGVIAGKTPVPTGTPVEVDLVDAANKRLPVFRKQAAAPIDQRQTFIVRIDPEICLSIAPGRYRIESKVGSVAARPLTIDIVDPQPRTHFTNLLSLKYNTLGGGGDYERVIQTGEGAEDLARWIGDLGYNAVMGMSYGVDRTIHNGVEIEQLVRERPELGPWESYYQPSGREKFMSALLRRNIRFYEDMFTYNDCMLPRDPRMRDSCARYASLETASMRFNPVFKGVNLYDEFYNSGDNGGAAIANMNYAAQEMTYRAKYATEGLTSARATKAFDRFSARPVGQRDYKDLVTFRTWPAHEDGEWRLFSDEISGAVKNVMPGAFNFTMQRFWGENGGNIAPNGTSADVFHSLDAASCVMYKDGGAGDRPVFAPMQANVLRIRDDIPVWTQIHDFSTPGIYGMHLVRQGFFALSQKIEGITFFDIVHDPHNPSPTDHRQTLKNLIGGVTEPYGDFLLSLDKGYVNVGIYYSRQADYLASRKPNSIPKACEGLWVACMRAGFPAQFITDDQLLAGNGSKYKVMFVPGITFEDETPPEILKELQRLVDAGKTIIVEKSSKLQIERIVRAESQFDEYDDKLGGAFPRYVDQETNSVIDRSEETTKLLRQLLPKYVQPATDTTMLFSPDWLKKGQGQYLVMSNFAQTKFTGLYKTLYQAPDMPTVRFPKRPVGAAYDVLEMKPVDIKTDGDWMSLQADLRDYPGKIYAFLPTAIGQVSLQCTSKVTGGKAITYHASIIDGKGQPIDAAFPIEVTLTNPAGETAVRLNRAAAPAYDGVYTVGSNAPGGTWKLKVRELISGATSEASITIDAVSDVHGVADDRTVWVRDAQQVKKFVADRTPALIVLDQDQGWAMPQAKRLADALTKSGKPTKVASADDSIRLPADFDIKNPTIDGTRLWRGEIVQPGLFVDAPVILMGKRLESRLIEGIVRRDALVETISADFPGPGRSIVAWMPRAFSTEFDSIMIAAQDEAGLAKGVDEFLAASGPAEIPIRQFAAAAPDLKATLAAGTSVAREPSSFRKNATMLDAVMTIDVDAATGRTLVGTFGYGENLFCFDAAGKLLWKQFLPEHNVYLAKWYDGGKRILAATGRGPWIFMLDPATGKVVRKFVASEWPDGHGYGGFWEGQTDTQVSVQVSPNLSQIIIGGRSGLLAVDYDGKKLWFRDRAEAITAYPANAEQNTAAVFNRTLEIGNFVMSADGTKIAQGESVIVGSTPGEAPGTVIDLWAYRPVILDAKTGAVLASNDSDPGSVRSWSISWPAGSPDPIVKFQSITMPLLADGKLGKPAIVPDGEPLPDGRFLRQTVSGASVVDQDGNTIWTTSDEHLFPLSLSSLNADRTKLFRCDVEGLVRCINLADGKVAWEHKLPFNGQLAALPDGGVAAGTINGLVVRIDVGGKSSWIVALQDLFERPVQDYGAYIQTALHRDPDNTGDLYPTAHDTAGDFDKTLRMGIEQLANGSFESLDGWTSVDGPVVTVDPAKDGAKSLAPAVGQLVTQRLKQRIIPQGTYLLEFWYLASDESSKLIAGAMLTGAADKQSLTASKFAGRPGEWTFGRLAVKALSDTQTIDIGFESEQGIVKVDLASFRPIRFPSANLLANAELQAIEPTFVRDIRIQYDRIPSGVRDRLMGKNHVAVYRQGPSNSATLYAQEQAFLHNGRTDDLGPYWSEPPDPMGFSAVLTKPAWISHVVLYLNNATPENTYRFISILANDLDTKLPRQVALVRGNDRRFVVVQLEKPILTDSIKILPGFHGGHKECLTEVELYGPLGGPSIVASGFPADDKGYPMFMGGPTHVPANLPADLSGTYVSEKQDRLESVAYLAGPTVTDRIFTWGNPAGSISSFKLALPAVATDPKQKPEPPKHGNGPTWNLATVTPTTTPARYAGSLIVGSADYQVHAVSDQGVYLWSFKAGGRVYSSPVPKGDDVYFGSDDGRLYKVDLHSGMLVWEFVTGDRVRSSPALVNGNVVVASFDGFLYAVNAESGQLAWKSPIAKFTRSSPAVTNDRIYIGDESGQMLCFNAADGALVWKQALGETISGCPLVTSEGAMFLSDQGDAAMVAPDGSVKWKRSLDARVKGEPFATKTQALVPTSEGLKILKRADGQDDTSVTGITPGQVIGAVVYDGKVCLIRASVATNAEIPPRTYAVYSSSVEIWGQAK